jgi:hypothetical protein
VKSAFFSTCRAASHTGRIGACAFSSGEILAILKDRLDVGVSRDDQ